MYRNGRKADGRLSFRSNLFSSEQDGERGEMREKKKKGIQKKGEREKERYTIQNMDRNNEKMRLVYV